MPVMIQVRNVPDALHRELVRRAEARGVTLTAYIQSILEREVGRPPVKEVIARIMAREPIVLSRPMSEYIHEGRAQRTHE